MLGIVSTENGLSGFPPFDFQSGFVRVDRGLDAYGELQVFNGGVSEG
jgi:hypothetical protein